MNDAKQRIEVKIIGKQYSVFCSPQEEEKLAAAVSFINDKTEELKQRKQGIKADVVCSRDSLLAITALNLSYELLSMNTAVSGQASEAEKLIKRIKNSFAQLDVYDAEQKSSGMSL